jgi:energy-coupling factor transporter ATP-binding protein EcfA2
MFIGIYARRYGTVSTLTEKSITEMELDEAERAHSSGIVRDLLLYLLDNRASWPAALEETDDYARRKLAHLRERIQVHTPSYFRDENDLLLVVTRDLHRKLNEHFRTSPLQIRDFVLPPAASLTQPVGMEFLGSAQRDYLIGRASTVAELTARIDENQLLLLLGDSGTGKTSLINAGIAPEAARLDWRPIYVRPLGLPLSDVTHQLQASLFKGGSVYRGPLLPLLLEILDVLPQKRLLLIIDQFEDILIARSREEVEKLIADLRAVYQSPDNRVRVVISYRADLEGRLGHFWQTITGSPAGLPRVYLTGLSGNDVESGVIKTAESLHVPISISAPEWEVIKMDLAAASAALGLTEVYPPHVQMLIEHIWKSTEKGKVPYTYGTYRKARGVDGIVGDFLGRQLEYADDKQGHVRLLLIALVRSYGVKAQKRLDELASETGLDETSVEVAIEKLIDLRLVRHIEQYYEIAHDFMARRVVSELVNSEEKEFKRFQELLSSKGHRVRGCASEGQYGHGA